MSNIFIKQPSQLQKVLCEVDACLIDVALMNASIHYFLRNPELTHKDGHRIIFFTKVSDALLDISVSWSSKYGNMYEFSESPTDDNGKAEAELSKEEILCQIGAPVPNMQDKVDTENPLSWYCIPISSKSSMLGLSW